MKKNPAIAFLAITSFLVIASCGDDHKEKYVPGAPKITLDITAKTITWDPIAGAASYNLYVKTVENCADVDTAEFQTPSTSDTVVEDISTPFSIADYTGCTTCYYAALAGKNNVGLGELSVGVGWQIRNSCP